MVRMMGVSAFKHCHLGGSAGAEGHNELKIVYYRQQRACRKTLDAAEPLVCMVAGSELREPVPYVLLRVGEQRNSSEPNS